VVAVDLEIQQMFGILVMKAMGDPYSWGQFVSGAAAGDEPHDVVHRFSSLFGKAQIREIPDHLWRNDFARGRLWGYDGSYKEPRGANHEYLQAAIDDQSRIAFATILPDQTHRRVPADNGSCYRLLHNGRHASHRFTRHL